MWMFVCVQHAYLLCRGDAPRACVWWLVARHDIMWKDRDYVQLNCMTQNYNRWVPKQGSVQCCYITLHPQGATMAHGIHTSRKLAPNCKRKVAAMHLEQMLLESSRHVWFLRTFPAYINQCKDTKSFSHGNTVSFSNPHPGTRTSPCIRSCPDITTNVKREPGKNAKSGKNMVFKQR